MERATAGMAHSHGDADTHKQGNAWAVRSITTVSLSSLAAECMGHIVSVHHNTCHSWLDQADIAAVATALVGLRQGVEADLCRLTSIDRSYWLIAGLIID